MYLCDICGHKAQDDHARRYVKDNGWVCVQCGVGRPRHIRDADKMGGDDATLLMEKATAIALRAVQPHLRHQPAQKREMIDKIDRCIALLADMRSALTEAPL